MGPVCFFNGNVSPPSCGVHNVDLEVRRIPIDDIAPDLGWVACYVCPVSEEVVRDPAPQK